MEPIRELKLLVMPLLVLPNEINYQLSLYQHLNISKCNNAVKQITRVQNELVL